MVFSNEEKQIWRGSEVMLELERIALDRGDMFDTPPEAHEPLGFESDEPTWEEESDKNKLLDAVEELEGVDEEIDEWLKGSGFGPEFTAEEELEEDDMPFTDLASNLIGGLTKLSYYLADSDRKSEAYRVEQAIIDLRIALMEANNG